MNFSTQILTFKSDVWTIDTTLDACGTQMDTDSEGNFLFSNAVTANTFRIEIQSKINLKEFKKKIGQAIDSNAIAVFLLVAIHLKIAF